MYEMAREMLWKLQAALPEARVYWEQEPVAGLRGAALSAELGKRKFSVHFEGSAADEGAENPEDSLVDDVVDDFLDFFARSIYPREKFTRII